MKAERFYTTGRQKKTDCFNVTEICSHCITVFEAMGCFYHFCPSGEVRPSLFDKNKQRGNKQRQLDELTRSYTKQKVLTVN